MYEILPWVQIELFPGVSLRHKREFCRMCGHPAFDHTCVLEERRVSCSCSCGCGRLVAVWVYSESQEELYAQTSCFKGPVGP